MTQYRLEAATAMVKVVAQEMAKAVHGVVIITTTPKGETDDNGEHRMQVDGVVHGCPACVVEAIAGLILEILTPQDRDAVIARLIDAMDNAEFERMPTGMVQ